MTFVPWNGLLGGTVAMGSPVAVAMGALLIGLLVPPPSPSSSGPSGSHGAGILSSPCDPRPQAPVRWLRDVAHLRERLAGEPRAISRALECRGAIRGERLPSGHAHVCRARGAAPRRRVA